jgi:hypothetical protein
MSFFAKKPSIWLVIILGLLMGFTSLIRPSLQYFSLITVFFLIFHYGWKRGAYYSVFLILGFVLVLGPWIIRNKITLDKYTDKNLMINFLHHGMYPDFTFNNIRESYGFPYRYDPTARKIAKDISSVLQEIIKRFDQEPLRHTKWFLLKKPIAFWSWDIVNGAGDVFIYPAIKSPYFNSHIFWRTHELMHKLHWTLVILSVTGCILVFVPNSLTYLRHESIIVIRCIALILIYYTVIHMVGAPFPRYSIPLRPFLYIMAFFPLYLVYKIYFLKHDRSL